MEQAHPKGRDRGMMRHPCYRVSVDIFGGASGAPIADQKGRVFGVNCTGVKGQSKLGYVTRINELLDLWINDTIIDGHRRDRVDVAELARAGLITFVPPIV